MDGLNDLRWDRMMELFNEYSGLVNYIMDVDVNPPNQDDYYTEGYSILRRCFSNANRLSALPADTSPTSSSGGEEERRKRELFKTRLDAYSRRHEARKIYLWQSCARRWVQTRNAILQGQRAGPQHAAQLTALDQQLRGELNSINDQCVYNALYQADSAKGSWTMEDPSLNEVLRWFRARR